VQSPGDRRLRARRPSCRASSDRDPEGSGPPCRGAVAPARSLQERERIGGRRQWRARSWSCWLPGIRPIALTTSGARSWEAFRGCRFAVRSLPNAPRVSPRAGPLHKARPLHKAEPPDRTGSSPKSSPRDRTWRTARCPESSQSGDRCRHAVRRVRAYQAQVSPATEAPCTRGRPMQPLLRTTNDSLERSASVPSNSVPNLRFLPRTRRASSLRRFARCAHARFELHSIEKNSTTHQRRTTDQ